MLIIQLEGCYCISFIEGLCHHLSVPDLQRHYALFFPFKRGYNKHKNNFLSLEEHPDGESWLWLLWNMTMMLISLNFHCIWADWCSLLETVSFDGKLLLSFLTWEVLSPKICAYANTIFNNCILTVFQVLALPTIAICYYVQYFEKLSSVAKIVDDKWKASLKKKSQVLNTVFVHCIIKEDGVDLGTLHKWQGDKVDQKITSLCGEIKYSLLYDTDVEESNRGWRFTIFPNVRVTSNQGPG